MATVTRYAAAPIERVFAVVSDPTTYPDWLVGAREIRSVDDDWPQPGSLFHHRVGLVGPLTVADSPEVLEVDAPDAPRARGAGPALRAGAGPSSGWPRWRADGVERTRITLDETVIGASRRSRAVLDPSHRGPQPGVAQRARRQAQRADGARRGAG